MILSLVSIDYERKFQSKTLREWDNLHNSTVKNIYRFMAAPSLPLTSLDPGANPTSDRNLASDVDVDSVPDRVWVSLLSFSSHI